MDSGNGKYRWGSDSASAGAPAASPPSGGRPVYALDVDGNPLRRSTYDNGGYSRAGDGYPGDEEGANGLEMDLEDSDLEEVATNACLREMQVNMGIFCSELRGESKEMKHTMGKMDFKKKIRGCFSLDKLKEIVPIIEWAPKYRSAELQGDLIAGMTVGLTVLPQAIAYTSIAGLAPAYGLYSAFIGCFVYVVFGTSKDMTLGPSAIMSLMTYSYGRSPIPKDPTFAIALGFYTGIVQLVMWVIGIGALIDFISFPVMKAFTSAAAITIGMSQVKKWWGLKGVPGDFIPQLIQTVKRIPETRLWDFVLGVICIVIIVALRKIKEIPWKTKWEDMTIGQKILNKTIWFLGTARNIIVIVLASVAAYLFLENGVRPFSLTGYIPPGIPAFRAPNLSVYDPETNKTYSASDVAGSIGLGFIVVPIIGLIEAMAIGKVFSRKFDYKMVANQEFLSYGIANFLGAFVMGYPVTGTFSRTAVNAASGVKTPAGGIVTGILVLLALQFLTPLFYYIPEASLAVVIIMAVLDMMTFHKVWIFAKTRRVDLIPWIVTFILSFVLSVEYGIALGVVVSFVILLYPATRPKMKTYEMSSDLWDALGNGLEKPRILIVELCNGLMYPAVPYIKDQILLKGKADKSMNGIILDFSHVANIDTTTVQGMRELLEDFHKLKMKVVVCNVQKDVSVIFRRAKPKYFVQATTLGHAVQVIAGITDENPKKLPQITYQSDVISNLVRQQMACCDDDTITSPVNFHANLGMDYDESEQEPRRNDSQAHFCQYSEKL